MSRSVEVVAKTEKENYACVLKSTVSLSTFFYFSSMFSLYKWAGKYVRLIFNKNSVAFRLPHNIMKLCIRIVWCWSGLYESRSLPHF